MFIGVAGSNGFGVYDNKNSMNRSKEFLRKLIEKEFDSYYAAFTWAKEIYNDMQDDVDDAFYGMSYDTKLNRITFRNEIRKMNLVVGT